MDIKQRIARQFSRAAGQYDNAALVQSDIAFDAMQLVPNQSQRLLDIGCGTGRVTRLLSDKAEQVLAMDIAEGMVTFARSHIAQPITWLTGDAEALPLQDASVDCVFSSMALQWCDNPQKVFAEIERVLEAGGRAVLAIMSDGSFEELNNCWASVDLEQHTNAFPQEETLALAAKEQGLITETHRKSYLTWHDNVRALLGSIKSIGANVVTAHSEPKMLKRSTLRDLQSDYSRRFEQQGRLPLTYNVCFLQLTKPGSNAQ